MTIELFETIKFISALVAVVILSFSGHPNEAVMVGLIGVIGTFKGRQTGVSDQTAQTLADKVAPVTGEAADAPSAARP